jgi:2-iminobutanoate/2-iminopropanoate deaminase
MRKTTMVDGAVKAAGHYVHAVIANRFVYVSGQGPADRQTNVVPDGFAAQVRQTLRNVQITLQGAGADLRDVVKVNTYLTDVTRFREYNEIYKEFIPIRSLAARDPDAPGNYAKHSRFPSPDHAPAVAPIMVGIARHESGLDPAAVHHNANGTIDVGIAQVNSANFGWLGLTMATAFDPCRNIAAGARVLFAKYNGHPPDVVKAAWTKPQWRQYLAPFSPSGWGSLLCIHPSRW